MSRYQSNSSSCRRAQDVLPLPRGFISISDLLDNSQGPGKEVSLIGVVKDCKLPIPTRGAGEKCLSNPECLGRILLTLPLLDHKSSLTLYDLSTQGDVGGIDLNIFRRKEEMPTVEAGDVIVVYTAKHQTYGGNSSLLTSYRTDIHIYAARQIPRLASSQSGAAAAGALRSPSRSVSRKPGDKEHEYVTWLYDTIDKQYIPDREDFAARAELSMNVRERFSLLASVQDHMFVDLIVQVVRKPFDLGDRVSMWVSDWTENDSLFHKTDDSPDWTDGMPVRDGDPYGYTTKFKKTTVPREADGKWRGPLGKRSIQLTCWEPHADYIRDQVDIGTWVHLRKVQIGYGHNSTNLEGFLRGEQGYSNFSDKIKVQILDPQADIEKIDPRLRDAIRRKRGYEKGRDQPKGGPKRKTEEPLPKDNTRTRRASKRAKRQRTFEEVEAKESKEQSIPDLNDLSTLPPTCLNF
jgi:predicted RNA-binding protein with RPS1 domain